MQRRPNSWWNQELEESRQRVRELSKSRTRSLAEGLRYKLARNRHRKLIAAARKKSWQTFCSSAESAKDVSQIVKSLQQKPARIVGLLVGDNGPTETPKEALDLLMRTHFPECTDRLDEPPEGVRQESSDVADYITTKLVKDAIRSFGPRKAPGPDGFHPMVLQGLSTSPTCEKHAKFSRPRPKSLLSRPSASTDLHPPSKGSLRPRGPPGLSLTSWIIGVSAESAP
jgi:hypothetical protein